MQEKSQATNLVQMVKQVKLGPVLKHKARPAKGFKCFENVKCSRSSFWANPVCSRTIKVNNRKQFIFHGAAALCN